MGAQATCHDVISSHHYQHSASWLLFNWRCKTDHFTLQASPNRCRRKTIPCRATTFGSQALSVASLSSLSYLQSPVEVGVYSSGVEPVTLAVTRPTARIREGFLTMSVVVVARRVQEQAFTTGVAT